MKLYDMKQAPNPRRLRMFLAEKGIEVETVQVDIPSGENLSDEFKAINPRGLLPTLVLDDGTAIDESVAISRYFEQLHPEPNLMGTDAKSMALIESAERHMEFDGLLSVAEAFRNSNPVFANRATQGTDGVQAIEALVERGRNGTARFFASLDATLGNSRYVAGDTFSIADITAFCVVDFAKWTGMRLGDEHPNAQRWYAEVAARPSAQA